MFLFPKTSFEDCGYFDQTLEYTYDYCKCSEFMKKYKFYHIEDILVNIKHDRFSCIQSSEKLKKEFYNFLIDIIEKCHIKEKNKEGMTVIMVSHDIETALHAADKVLHLAEDDYFFGTKSEYVRSALCRRFLGGKK
jgi:Txe/YoeB family toxin of Txe-Axe toxin-antitoxin module